VSIRWLAAGEGKMGDVADDDEIPIAHSSRIPNEEPFGEAYDQQLKYVYQIKKLRSGSTARPKTVESCRLVLKKAMEFWDTYIPPADYESFVRVIWDSGERFRREKVKAMLNRSANCQDPFELFSE
jgi:hypothetical protein